MQPIICRIGPYLISSYALMLVTAIVVCSHLLAREASLRGIKPKFIYNLVFWVIVTGIIGARIFYVLLNLPLFLKNLLEVVMIQYGGLSSFGGLLFGALTGLWLVHREKINLKKFVDLACPYLALGQAIGRIGCLLNGCCYGKPWACGIYFPVHHANLHPTQLYESLGFVFIFVFLRLLQKESKIQGTIFVFYIFSTALLRFAAEYFRAAHPAGFWDFSLSQWICLVMMALSASTFFFSIDRKSPADL